MPRPRRPRTPSQNRAAFREEQHRRGPGGRFADKPGAGDDAPRKLVGEQRLKTSGVTGGDTIVLRSTRLRSYSEGQTVEAFVGAHPKGRAYALRKLAADHKKGVIGFRGATDTQIEPPASVKPPILTKDTTNPAYLPKPGTPERAFHDDMLRASSVFGKNSKLDVVYDDGKPYRFKVDVLNDAGDEEIGLIERVFSTDRDGNRVVKHDIFMLDDSLQGAGKSKQFLARSIPAYRHLGIDKIKLQANIDVGGYAWLKYGFRPDRDGAEALTKHATDRVELLRKDGHIDDAMYGHLKRSINFQDFQSVIDIGGSRKVEFEGRSQSLGKHIFLNSDWTGELDLNSRTAMMQFNGYIGGVQ